MSQILAFSAAAAVVTVVPGVDTMLVIRSTLRAGLIGGVVTAAGICSGLFVHASFMVSLSTVAWLVSHRKGEAMPARRRRALQGICGAALIGLAVSLLF